MFVGANKAICKMKYNELHRLIKKNGWQVKRQKGSHVIYVKNNRTYPVPNHGAKEIPRPTEIKIKKDMGL